MWDCQLWQSKLPVEKMSKGQNGLQINSGVITCNALITGDSHKMKLTSEMSKKTQEEGLVTLWKTVITVSGSSPVEEDYREGN
jgi:hypothetical protein